MTYYLRIYHGFWIFWQVTGQCGCHVRPCDNGSLSLHRSSTLHWHVPEQVHDSHPCHAPSSILTPVTGHTSLYHAPSSLSHQSQGTSSSTTSLNPVYTSHNTPQYHAPSSRVQWTAENDRKVTANTVEACADTNPCDAGSAWFQRGIGGTPRQIVPIAGNPLVGKVIPV